MSRYENYAIKNNVFGTLSAPISSLATTIQLNDGQGARFSINQLATLENIENGKVMKREIVLITAINGDVLTVERKYAPCPSNDDANTQGQVSFAFSSDDTISAYIDKEHFDRIENGFENTNDEIDDILENGDYKLRTYKTTGLGVEVKAGPILVGSSYYDFAGGTLTLTDNATNYIEIDEDGNLVVNTSDWIDENTKISKVVTSGGEVISIEDWRLGTVGGRIGGVNIHDLTEKDGLVGNDEFIVADSQNIYQNKKVKYENIFSNLGDGSDGDCYITTNTVLCAKSWNFRNLTINSGVSLCFCGEGIPVLRVKENFCNNGTICLQNRLLGPSIGRIVMPNGLVKTVWNVCNGVAPQIPNIGGCGGVFLPGNCNVSGGDGGSQGCNGCAGCGYISGGGGAGGAGNQYAGGGGGGGGYSTQSGYCGRPGCPANGCCGGNGGNSSNYCGGGGGGGFGLCQGGNGGNATAQGSGGDGGNSFCRGGNGGYGFACSSGAGLVHGGKGGDGCCYGGNGGLACPTGFGGIGGNGGHGLLCRGGDGGCGGCRCTTSNPQNYGGNGGDSYYGCGGNGGQGGIACYGTAGGNGGNGGYGYILGGNGGCGGLGVRSCGGNGGRGGDSYCQGGRGGDGGCGCYASTTTRGGNGGNSVMGMYTLVVFASNVKVGNICGNGGNGGDGGNSPKCYDGGTYQLSSKNYAGTGGNGGDGGSAYFYYKCSGCYGGNINVKGGVGGKGGEGCDGIGISGINGKGGEVILSSLSIN